MRIHRVLALPPVEQREANAIYLVKSPQARYFTTHITLADPSNVTQSLPISEVTSEITRHIAGLTKVKMVRNIQERNLLQFDSPAVVIVKDASGQEGVTSGGMAYSYTPGEEDPWEPLFALNLSLSSQVRWGDIVQAPQSSAEEIDEAVAWKHQHENLSTLNKLGEQGGHVYFNGKPLVTTERFDW